MVETKVRSNQVVECIRFLCCILILFIHAGFPLPAEARSSAVAAARFAVPFLIILSGWYVDHDGGTKRAKKKIKDTIRIVLIGGCICILWNCVNSYIQSSSFFSWINVYRTKETAINFLLYNRAIFFNSVFYYFFIMIYVYAIFIAAQKLHLTWCLCLLMPALLVGGIYICEFTDLPWYYGGNFIFLGLPFFFLGYLLRFKQDGLKKLKSKEWLFIIIGFISTLLEHHFLGGRFLYIGSVITAVFLFIFCINHEQLECPQYIVAAGTSLSLPMIVIHCQVRDSLKIIRDLGPYGLPILVFFYSLLLALSYQKIRGRL